MSMDRNSPMPPQAVPQPVPAPSAALRLAFVFLALATASLAARPALVPGEWTDITPKAAGVDPAANIFCQGMALDPSDPSVIYLCVCGFDVSKPVGLYKS